jgi:hypothetical protein
VLKKIFKLKTLHLYTSCISKYHATNKGLNHLNGLCCSFFIDKLIYINRHQANNMIFYYIYNKILNTNKAGRHFDIKTQYFNENKADIVEANLHIVENKADIVEADLHINENK